MNSRLIIVALLFIIACEHKSSKGKWEDYDPDDFYPVQGMVYKVRTHFSYRYLETVKDIYYMYHLELDTPFTGILKNTPYIYTREGDPIVLLVYKNDPCINFFRGSGIIDTRFKTTPFISKEDTTETSFKKYEFKQE